MEFAASGSWSGLAEYEADRERKRLEMMNALLLAKQTTWLTLLTGAFLIFYLMDILQQSMLLLVIRI